MFGSSDVLHSQIHVAFITRFLVTHAQIQQKIQLHAQTSVAVIKCAENKKSEEHSYQKCWNWPYRQWNLIQSNFAQISAHPKPCLASQGHTSMGAPWTLTGATRGWIEGWSVAFPSTSQFLHQCQEVLEVLQKWLCFGPELRWPLSWMLTANRGQCWDAKTKDSIGLKSYSHRNEIMGKEKSYSCF